MQSPFRELFLLDCPYTQQLHKHGLSLSSPMERPLVMISGFSCWRPGSQGGWNQVSQVPAEGWCAGWDTQVSVVRLWLTELLPPTAALQLVPCRDIKNVLTAPRWWLNWLAWTVRDTLHKNSDQRFSWRNLGAVAKYLVPRCVGEAPSCDAIFI